MSDSLKPDKHSPSIYYNIDYRTYSGKTAVRSFTTKELTVLSPLIEKVQKKLLEPSLPESTSGNEEIIRNDIILKPGDSSNLSLSGNKAICVLKMKISADNLPQALRSTVLKMTFDGERTVWAPVGDFFGTGYQIRQYQTLYSCVDEDSTLTSYWLMPFHKNAEITIGNLGNQEVSILKFNIMTKRYHWRDNSMHFGVSWNELHNIESVKTNQDNDSDGHFDVNFVTLKGKGVYMGTGLTVFNTVDAWWGEGDEKVWVDNDTFPSFIGTGTEDYFGYAWCLPAKFSHFLIAQPDGSGNFHPGMSVNLRFYLLDRIPFNDSLRFDMELWHWVKTQINYAPISYWYILPGGTCNITPSPETVNKPVALKMTDLIKPKPLKNGIMEGEDLRVLNVSNGGYYIQSIKELEWSNNAQLWWIARADNSTLTADFIVPENGKYKIEMEYTKAIDYADFKIAFNGKFCDKKFSGYHDQTGKDVIKDSAELGIFSLKKGRNTVTIKTTGKNPSAVPQYMVGIDFFKFTKLINEH